MNKNTVKILTMLGLASSAFATQIAQPEIAQPEEQPVQIQATLKVPTEEEYKLAHEGMVKEESAVDTQNQKEETAEEAKARIEDELPKVEDIDADSKVKDFISEINQTNLDDTRELEAKYRALTNLEKQRTVLLQEKQKQRKIFIDENQSNFERKLNQQAMLKDAMEKKQAEEAKKQEEEKAQEQVSTQNDVSQQAPLAIPDQINVYSVYSLNKNTYAEIKINGNKYIVSKGEEILGGYKVSKIDKYGATLINKDGEEAFYPVSANTEQASIPVVNNVNTGNTHIQAKTPNVIKPYELK